MCKENLLRYLDINLAKEDENGKERNLFYIIKIFFLMKSHSQNE